MSRHGRILSEARIEGAVLMEIADYQNDLITTGGEAYLTRSPYSSFWGYWDYGWPVLYTPGNVIPKTTVIVQTLVYSIDQDKLLWVGTSKTTNPEKTDLFVKQLADAAGREIKKTGLLQR